MALSHAARAEQQGWLLKLDPARAAGVAGLLLEEARRASDRVYSAARETRCLPSEWLSGLTMGRARVSLKLENEQVTGAFKIRGATNKVLSLAEADGASGFTTASSGNHALALLTAVAASCPRDGLTIYLPRGVDPGKAERLARLGARLVYHGRDCVEAEAAARAACEGSSLAYISPYNDLQVAAGQGTIGWELLAQLPAGPLRAYIPVGGGGLAAGIAAVLKAHTWAAAPGGPGAPGGRVHIVGCQPAASNVMQQSVAAGRVVEAESLPTLSDGTAGGVEAGAVTFEACRALVDEWVSVSEGEIARAMLAMERHHGARVEGAAGVALAAFLRQAPSLAEERAVVVVCGGNVSEGVWAQARDLVEGGG